MLGEVELPTGYLLVQVLVRGAPEGELTAKHCVKQDSCSPDISWWTNVFLLHYYLRAHVRWCSAEDLQFDITGRTATEAEIDYLDAILFGLNDDVFKLDVAMCDVALVEVHERPQHLLDDALGLILREAPLILSFQVGVEALPHRVLHDQVDILWRVDRLVQLDYVRMGQAGQNSDLADRLLLPLRVLQLRPVVLLYRDFLSTGLVDAFFDHSVGTDTDLIAEMVRA